MIKKRKISIPLIYTFITIFLLASIFMGGNIIKAESAVPIADDSNWNENSVRPFLVYTRSDTFGGVIKKNAMHVFAFEGETICLGTNIYNSSLNLEGTGYRANDDGKAERDSNHNDLGSIDIVMEDLSGNKTGIDITGVPGSDGYIPNVATETLAKNMTSVEGASDSEGNVYKPYTYIVSETGVYTFEFRSFNGVGTTNNIATDAYKKNGWIEPTASNNQGALIAAWDITVFNENGEKEKGRTYADYLQLQMAHTGQQSLKEKYYVMTNDSYIYEMKFLGIQPYTFSFFANNRGITDAATGNIIYKSVKDLKNTITFQKFGINYTNPSIDDTDLNKNFYIFFEEPSKDLQGYLYEKAMLPDPATNLKFIKDEDTIEGMGGYFSFDVKGASTATLRIEFNIPDHIGEYAPVEISDVVVPYQTSYFYWDGKDGNGKEIPAGNYSYEELKYTVTTKAGEIHFPLIDVENVLDGITFTRVNDIYDKDGNIANINGSIYDVTKNVIYYDETAIYYGEKITQYGTATEADVTYSKTISSVATDVKMPYLLDVPNNTNILGYRNISYTANNEYKLYGSYGSKHNLRIGDHSAKNNQIDYSTTPDGQMEVINYLDSATNPVGQSKTSGGAYVKTTDPLVQGITGTASNNVSTTDYGIANYWTFTPADKVEASDKSDKITILEDNDNHFNLISRVFYDTSKSSGIFNQQSEGDHLLGGITLNLYKKTQDNTPEANKSYVRATTTNGKITLGNITSFASNTDIYELVKTDVTPLQGTYQFNGLEYDKDNGTEFIFQVVRPNTSYQVTSENKTAANNIKSETTSFISCKENTSCTSQTTKQTYNYGPYIGYAYDPAGKGTEVQKFVVGGSGINLDSQANKTISTIDVGYYYDRNSKSLKIKKEWNTKSEESTPNIVVYEVSYNSNNIRTDVYEERALTASLSWSYSYEYLPTKIDGLTVSDYYVSAEYYIIDDKIYRHQFDYDIQKHIYKSFVGTDSYFSLTDYYTSNNELTRPTTFGMDNLPDINKDGKSDLNDLRSIPEASDTNQNGWRKAKSAGTSGSGEVVAKYNSVLDRNPGSAVNEITITNAEAPGTIEILKYTGDIIDNQYLDGATFRIYQGSLETVKEIVENYNKAQADLANASSSLNIKELKENFEKASQALDDIQVGSGSTRVNGRIAFAGLDPDQTYTIRERFAPSGYRILNEYYQVNPKSSSTDVKFNNNNYYLLPVGNATASGDLEIRSMIDGRAWLPTDSFKYDISFNYNTSDKSGVSIDISEQTLFNKNFDTEVSEFVKTFNDTQTDFTIDYASDYANNGSSLSADTKIFNELLHSGDVTSAAGLMEQEFPAAGTYTFTIKQLPLDEESTIIGSSRVFKITVNVKRVLDDPNSNDEVTKDNKDTSHLEASVSNITYQEGSSTDNLTYAGSTPTFINEYNVKDVQQKLSYQIVSELTGRANNIWLDSDSFTYTIDGDDETTREAILNNNIIIGGNFGKVSGSDTAKSITINNSAEGHKFIFDYIEFDNIHFPVERENDDATPTTQPVEYIIKITQNKPADAANNVYKGITYSQDEYTLKIKLVNSAHEITGEVDGIIDEITMELFKNGESLGQCIIKEELGDDGVVHKTEEHSKNHVMTFTNVYKTTSTEWKPIVSKTIVGREWVKDDNFKFNITTTNTDGVQMPTNTTVVIKPTENDLTKDTYTADMDIIKFTKAGNYKFNINETFEVNGMTIDSSNYIVNVEITDNNEGELLISFDGNSSSPKIAFVNTYKESGNIGFAIAKTLKGRKWSSKDNFKFIIKPNEKTLQDINAKIIEVSTDLGKLIDDHYEVTITNSDKELAEVIKELQNITINKGNAKDVQYSFTISEDLTDVENIECSQNKVNLDLNVSRKLVNNIPSGELEIVATYAYLDDLDNKTNANDKVTIPFTNYAYVDSELSITTDINGREWFDDETFNVTTALDKEENVKSLSGNYKSLLFTKDNKQKVLKFRFYEPGTYTFTIKEEKAANVPSGLSIDSSIFTVEYKVVDADGELKVSKTIKKNEIEYSIVEFINEYTTGTLNIINVVKGSQADINKTFTFKITLSDNTINDEFDGVKFENGVATIVMTGNKTTKISNLPSGVNYEVEELEANTEDFTTTMENETGEIKNGHVSDVTFENIKYYNIPNTGGSITYWIFNKLVLLFEILLGIYILKKFIFSKIKTVMK